MVGKQNTRVQQNEWKAKGAILGEHEINYCISLQIHMEPQTGL